MDTIGSRLKQERKRLGLSQDAITSAAGLNRNVQIRYEKDDRVPDAEYLAAIAKIGVDIAYVVTGNACTLIDSDEGALIGKYRNASAEIKTAVHGLLGAVLTANSPPPDLTKQKQVIKKPRAKEMAINIGTVTKKSCQ